MPINLQMPALSPTMEEGTLAKWLVKEGDAVSSGDLLAEIETDKATMEFEAIDEGTIAKIVIAEGTDNVKVGDVIAIIAEDGEDVDDVEAAPAPTPAPKEEAKPEPKAEEAAPTPPSSPAPPSASAEPAPASGDGRIKASPLARRLAEEKGVDLTAVNGSGPGGRIVKSDIEAAEGGTAPAKVETATPAPSAAPAPTPTPPANDFEIPHSDEKLSGMRKTIARRLSQSMQEAPHIYLTVDCRLDALLELRKELNENLAEREIKVSVNDMLIKALAVALEQVPECNVSFMDDMLRRYERQDISVAVSIPGGLITPVVVDATSKSLSKIATETKDLAARAQEGKLKIHEYQGGTASISNMGMMGIKHFTAVINPPQSMILAVGAGEKRPYVVDDVLTTATVMTVTGSFDHRAIDGADGAKLLAAFKALVEKPLGMLA